MNWYIPPFFLIELNIPYNSQSHRTDDAKHNFSLDFDLVAAGNVFDFFLKIVSKVILWSVCVQLRASRHTGVHVWSCFNLEQNAN